MSAFRDFFRDFCFGLGCLSCGGFVIDGAGVARIGSGLNGCLEGKGGFWIGGGSGGCLFVDGSIFFSIVNWLYNIIVHL